MSVQNQNRDEKTMTNSSEVADSSVTTGGAVGSQVEVVIQPPTPDPNSINNKFEHTTMAAITTDLDSIIDKTKTTTTTMTADDVAVVVWEATVTGRRLIDEMINLGSYYVAAQDGVGQSKEEEEEKEGGGGGGGGEHQFNEYVMPYGKLPLNVIRNYNLRIVDTGRYRMLKEIRHNRMLKSKSEVAAVNDLATWLIQLQRKQFPNKKIVLVYFEPRHSKILQLFQVSPLFLLSPSFCIIV